MARVDHGSDYLQRRRTTCRDDTGAAKQSGSVFVGGTTYAVSQIDKDKARDTLLHA